MQNGVAPIEPVLMWSLAQTIHLRSLAPFQVYLVGIKDGLRKPLVESAHEQLAA
jgi:hypothetical protein